MTAAVKRHERDELRERAETIAGWATSVANVVTDVALVVTEHSETIAEWTLRLRRNPKEQ